MNLGQVVSTLCNRPKRGRGGLSTPLGQLQREVLDLLRDSFPGEITSNHLKEALDIRDTRACRLLRMLAERGHATRTGTAKKYAYRFKARSILA